MTRKFKQVVAIDSPAGPVLIESNSDEQPTQPLSFYGVFSVSRLGVRMIWTANNNLWLCFDNTVQQNMFLQLYDLQKEPHLKIRAIEDYTNQFFRNNPTHIYTKLQDVPIRQWPNIDYDDPKEYEIMINMAVIRELEQLWPLVKSMMGIALRRKYIDRKYITPIGN